MPPIHTAEANPPTCEPGLGSHSTNSASAAETPTASTHSAEPATAEPPATYPAPANNQNTTAGSPTAGAYHAVARDKRIDCLRGIAVLAVVFVHSVIRIPFLFKAGWMGVDLFFVLSGFLISGLLFREYQMRQTLDAKRFFIRRGFKIYPSFWLFIGVTWAMSLFNHDGPQPRLRAYLHELLFVQNYFYGVWPHTWSLAVEEHFYIALPLFLLALTRLSRNRQDPFRSVAWCALVIALACIISRAALVLIPLVPNFNLAYRSTHARIDGLFFGVLLGYLYHYHGEKLASALHSTLRRIAIALASFALLLPGYFAGRDSKTYSILAYTMVYLGCGGILLLSIHVRGVLPPPARRWLAPIADALAFIGMYSYSIYLWHYVVREWPDQLAYGFFHVALPPIPYFLLYLLLTLTMGITLSRAIEYPILKVRDRLFPEPTAGLIRSGRGHGTI